jgi:hypothetical protein
MCIFMDIRILNAGLVGGAVTGDVRNAGLVGGAVTGDLEIHETLNQLQQQKQ